MLTVGEGEASMEEDGDEDLGEEVEEVIKVAGVIEEEV